jgi:hypothetical protein
MNRQTMKKGGWKLKNFGIINNVLNRIKLNKNSRCKRKLDNIFNMCLDDKMKNNFYNNIIKSVIKETLTEPITQQSISKVYFWHINPNKRQFIFESTYQVLGQIKSYNKLTTNYINEFPYIFLVIVYNNMLNDYNEKYGSVKKQKIISIPCDIFGLIPSDVDLQRITEAIGNKGSIVNNYESRLTNINDFISIVKIPLGKKTEEA